MPDLAFAPRAVADYLREWADRIDPSHTADLPSGLQGQPPGLSDARLLELPFAFVEGGLPTTDYAERRDCPLAQPATEHRPRNVVPRHHRRRLEHGLRATPLVKLCKQVYVFAARVAAAPCLDAAEDALFDAETDLPRRRRLVILSIAAWHPTSSRIGLKTATRR